MRLQQVSAGKVALRPLRPPPPIPLPKFAPAPDSRCAAKTGSVLRREFVAGGVSAAEVNQAVRCAGRRESCGGQGRSLPDGRRCRNAGGRPGSIPQLLQLFEHGVDADGIAGFDRFQQGYLDQNLL